MKKKIFIGLIAITSLFILASCGTNKLDGTYSAKVDLLLLQFEGSYVFDGDKVTEEADGEVNAEGTYEIEKNTLTMKFDDRTETAKLSDDKKSFVFVDDESEAAFKKEEK